EPQTDGHMSETESNCSAVSGIQTPSFIRVTRRRQIVVPYQPDSPGRKRYLEKLSCRKLNRKLDEDDVSEAESCSSTVSGIQMPNVSRTTRSRQSKKKLQLDADHEDNSLAESCCLSSHVEPSTATNRITRSMQIKSQAECTKTEKGNREQLSDTEDASSNKETSSPGSSKSASATWREDVKEVVLNDVTCISLTELKQTDTELLPGKKAVKNTQTIGIDYSEEACCQIQEDHSEMLVREGKLESMDISSANCLSPKQFLESQGKMPSSQSTKNQECKRVDAEADAQQSFIHTDKLRKGEQASVVSSLEKALAYPQKADSIGRCRMLEICVDSGEDQTGEHAESVSHSSERSKSGDNSVVQFLSKDENEESENSDVAVTAEENLCKKADEKTPSLKKSSENSSVHAEGLFVIDTEPGMSSSQKYYLDEVDQDSDAGSKHKGSEKAEESDLEEDEEELIDEDEKDGDDLLKNKIDILHLSSSIDPGLNMKKLGGLYISFDAKKQKHRSSLIKLKEEKDKVLQRSIITPDFEKKECVPPLREALHQLKKQRRAEREKTTGDGWFGMKAPEITNELKNDLKVLKMRASLDPKHFYKKNDRDGLPKYFQVGTVVDSPIDFYHSRIPKKQRKRTIVEELLEDSEFRRYNKKKYQEIMSEKAAFAAGKRNRKKKKLHN
ncbi:TDIF2 protein, partial [Upupa epops]|nr:TDIF2 protein [Upupa epops]